MPVRKSTADNTAYDTTITSPNRNYFLLLNLGRGGYTAFFRHSCSERKCKTVPTEQISHLAVKASASNQRGGNKQRAID